MSIYKINGDHGQVTTTMLPSGDLAVSCPSSGPLEQLVFSACRWHGRRAPNYGGWIVPSEHRWKVTKDLDRACIKISD